MKHIYTVNTQSNFVLSFCTSTCTPYMHLYAYLRTYPTTWSVMYKCNVMKLSSLFQWENPAHRIWWAILVVPSSFVLSLCTHTCTPYYTSKCSLTHTSTLQEPLCILLHIPLCTSLYASLCEPLCTHYAYPYSHICAHLHAYLIIILIGWGSPPQPIR